MRASLLVGAFMVALAFAGCVTTDPVLEDNQTVTPAPLLVEVPDGARLVEEVGRSILEWSDVTLPFSAKVKIPEGTTLVSAIGVVAEGAAVRPYMVNSETGRRRCNPASVDAWNIRVTGSSACSGLAAIDPAGTTWTVSVSGASVAPLVQVVFSSLPVDGLASSLDLSKLSMPTYELEPTQYMSVGSFDGTPLWVEVTLPVGEGPWPTVLASSPYNGQTGRGTTPAMWEYFTHDWAKRGYVVVNADVRGFGMSGGCVEVWGINEQKDQAFLVDWVAEQTWSDGNVGFYGQSYVATTPVAAAVQNPEALKAIIAVAPVMNAYYDWHFGGVPNGESSGSPVAYQVLTDTGGDPLTTDPATLVANFAKGVCDPLLVQRANDPRALYNEFYVERNFSARAKDVTAAVLYTQGFEDSNVKSAMIPDWFNAITAPKLGLFGHWVHQHPTRADEEVLFLGWMDQYVKGRDLGFEKLPAVEIVVNASAVRRADAWPPVAPEIVALASDFAKGTLGPQGGGPTATIVFDGSGGAGSILSLKMPVDEAIALAGVATLGIRGTLHGAGNAYFTAELYDGDALVTYGMMNLAHRSGHEKYEPAHAAEEVAFDLPFLPTEHVFEAGRTMRLVIRGTQALDHGLTMPGQPGAFTMLGGDGTTLALPVVSITEYLPAPASAMR